jgi:hypothetical protein
MEAKLVAVLFVCNDGKVRQVALSEKEKQKLESLVVHNVCGGVLKLIKEPLPHEPKKG